MVHPGTALQFINDKIGFGVVATEFIPKGTITWASDGLDQIISPGRVPDFPECMRAYIDKYAYKNGGGDLILCWDHSRFINHSCHPTSLAPGFDIEIAVRDIYPGEQVTDDYGTLNLEAPFECACGAADCRSTVGPGDFHNLVGTWDRLVQDAFPFARTVAQPLWELVREKDDIRRVMEGAAPLPSIRVHYAGAPVGQAAAV